MKENYLMILLLLRTLLSYFLLIIISCITLIPCFLLSFLPPKSKRYDNKLYYFFMGLFYKLSCAASFLPITIKGKENLIKGPAIYAANHQSALDIILVGSLLNFYPHIWFFKTELASMFALGKLMKRMNIAVDRTTAHAALRGLLQGIKLAQEKNRSLIIFPEGGRYIDGEVHDFLWGFAILARKIGRPVVPVMIKNANKVYPPGSFYIRNYPITVIIGKQFIVGPEEGDEAFIKRVYAWFVEQSKES